MGVVDVERLCGYQVEELVVESLYPGVSLLRQQFTFLGDLNVVVGQRFPDPVHHTAPCAPDENLLAPVLPVRDVPGSLVRKNAFEGRVDARVGVIQLTFNHFGPLLCQLSGTRPYPYPYLDGGADRQTYCSAYPGQQIEQHQRNVQDEAMVLQKLQGLVNVLPTHLLVVICPLGLLY